MKPDEKYALETLVEKYGGKYIKGDEPPDGYLVSEDGKRIAVEVTRLIQHVTDDNRFTKPRLADDEPGHELLDQLDIELSNKIPTDKYIFIILPTPVNNVSKTKQLLASKILDLINSSATEAEFDVCSNPISISVFNGERSSGKKSLEHYPILDLQRILGLTCPIC